MIFYSSDYLLMLSLALSLLLLVTHLYKREPFWKSLVFLSASTIVALIGARLFHVIWERPQYYYEHPDRIFTRLDGLTFYGSVISCALFLYFFIPRFFKEENKARIWDLASIGGALCYAILRIDCYIKGCCWGKLTTMPWAVVYKSEESIMPYLGIPVHPVQLYDSFHGFILAAILYYVFRKEGSMRGQLIWLFCILYGIGRFVTENFRGDSYRGTHVALGMSTSQIISLALILAGIFKLRKFWVDPAGPTAEIKVNG